ncbi:MAG: DASH family cryptochrome [Opitutae bacterium]
MKKGLLWLRNDLRLADNPALHWALAECGEVLFVYVFDERSWNPNRMGPFRAQFQHESLSALREKITGRGGKIEFVRGRALDEIPKLMKSYGAQVCYAQREDAHEEVSEERALAKKVELVLTPGKGLFEEEDLPFALDELPHVFSHFRRKVQKNLRVRDLCPEPRDLACSWKGKIPLPKLTSLGFEETVLDERAVLVFRGGEEAGWNRINEWMWDRACLQRYKDTRNGLVGADYSSKLSPWLANGCLSAAQVFWEIQRYEEERVANDSTYWLFFELLWREFFRFVGRRFGHRLFIEGGIKEEETYDSQRDSLKLKNWRLGQTQDDFVNANMVELVLTGWMSNRGRQNVASYLIHELGQSWLDGARFFERNLIDFDPCSNYGNWAYLGGVGNDPRPNRAFNLPKQAEIYDPDGSFRKLWLGVSESPS